MECVLSRLPILALGVLVAPGPATGGAVTGDKLPIPVSAAPTGVVVDMGANGGRGGAKRKRNKTS